MYDYLFVTNLPSFYKINFYNRLVEDGIRIKVVFLDKIEKSRNNDFINSDKANFKFIINPKLQDYLKLLITTKYNYLVLGGWERVFYWIPNIFLRKKKLGLILESTIIESKTSGLLYELKKYFLKNIDIVFAPSRPHSELVNRLGYQSKVIYTYGVGIINNSSNELKYSGKKRFIFIGRLIIEKNLFFILDYFKKNTDLELVIIGEGYLKNEISHSISDYRNIKMLGYIDNAKLSHHLYADDILILPSISETWGLVVEEALNLKMPVLISKNVGCVEYFIDNLSLGLSFNPYSHKSLDKAIRGMLSNFTLFKERIMNYSNDKKDLTYISAFKEPLKK